MYVLLFGDVLPQINIEHRNQDTMDEERLTKRCKSHDSHDIVSVLSMDSAPTCSTLQGHERHQNKPVRLKYRGGLYSSHGERQRELINLSCTVQSIKVFTMTSTWTLTLKWNTEDWLRCHFHNTATQYNIKYMVRNSFVKSLQQPLTQMGRTSPRTTNCNLFSIKSLFAIFVIYIYRTAANELNYAALMIHKLSTWQLVIHNLYDFLS